MAPRDEIITAADLPRRLASLEAAGDVTTELDFLLLARVDAIAASNGAKAP